MTTNNSPNDAEHRTQQQTGTQSWGGTSSVNATCACSAIGDQQHQTDPNNNAKPGPGPPQDTASRNLEFAFMGSQFEGYSAGADQQA